MVERFSLSLASTGLNCPSLNSFTSSTRTRESGWTHILFSFPLGLNPSLSLPFPWDRPSRSEHLRRWDHETKPIHILWSWSSSAGRNPYLLLLDWAQLAYWQKSSPKKLLFVLNSLCLLMSQGLEEELPDLMLELRSFLTLPMKPEIRVGIGEASSRLPLHLVLLRILSLRSSLSRKQSDSLILFFP